VLHALAASHVLKICKLPLELEFLPFETLISKNQNSYYQALSKSDKQGESTIFIEFMLTILGDAIDELLAERPGPISCSERIRIFLSSGVTTFTRKNYMNYFKTISSATASRDIIYAVNENLVQKFGDKNKSIYKVK
jgi:Fic family protein